MRRRGWLPIESAKNMEVGEKNVEGQGRGRVIYFFGWRLFLWSIGAKFYEVNFHNNAD
jgi:hypothetical protein